MKGYSQIPGQDHGANFKNRETLMSRKIKQASKINISKLKKIIIQSPTKAPKEKILKFAANKVNRNKPANGTAMAALVPEINIP